MTTSCTSTSSCLWQETQGSVSVTNGIFQVELGSSCALTSGSCNNSSGGPINFATNNALYLTMQFNGDTSGSNGGFMSPLIHITSVPFALQADNASTLGGIASSGFIQNGVSPQSSTNFNIDGTGIAGALQTSSLDTASSAALAIGNSYATSIGLGNTSSNIPTTINGTLLVEPTPSNDSPTAFQVQSAGGTNTLLTADTTDNEVIIGDGTGTGSNTTQFIVDSSTTDPSSGTDGSIYYNTTEDKFRCYQAGAWADCLGATSNSTLSLLSGLANVGANVTDAPVETLVFTSNTAENDTAGATGFTAAAGGSFRTCLIKNDAAITAGTLDLRWTVNGSEVGSPACSMDSGTYTRSSSSALDAGVVTFSQGDTIGIAFDTSSSYAPTTDDFTVFWTIEYNSTLTNAGATLQSAYDNYNILDTTDGHDLVVNATDTTTDANVLINLECVTACGSNGRFAVQNAGTDAFSIAPNGGAALFSNNSSSGLVVQDSSTSKGVLTVDTSGDQVLLGTAGGSGLNGKIVFNNSSGSGTAAITLAGNPSTNYTYQLPTSTVSSNQCLQSGTVSGGNVPLTFAACGGGSSYTTVDNSGTPLTQRSTLNFTGNSVSCADNSGSSRTDCTIAPTLKNTYDNGGSGGGGILLTSTGGGIVLQNATADALSTLFTIENNAATFNYLTATLASGVPHLKVFGASSTNYADIYYDNSTSTAYFTASSGTTSVGSGSGPVNILPGAGAGVTITGNAASNFTTTSGALTLTAAAASTWSTSSGNLTLDSGGGTLVLGSNTTTLQKVATSLTLDVNNSSNSTLTVTNSGSGNASLSVKNNVSIGSGSSYTGSGAVNISSGGATALSLDTGGGAAINIGATNATSIVLGGNSSATTTDKVANSSATAYQLQTAGGTAYITADTTDSLVVIGSNNESNTNLVLLQLNSDSDYSSDEGTCSTSGSGTNLGAMYYNTNTQAIRACINGGWEDIVSTAALGLQLFGVVPDSGATPGDLLGISGTGTGPCKVYMGSATTKIRWTGCIAYSGGRKIVVPAQASDQTVTLTNGHWSHVCLNSSGVVTITDGTTEIANLATVSYPSATAPLVCLADLTVNGTAITAIYDTRTFTTTTKEFVNVITTAAPLGAIVQQTTTPGSVTKATATANLASLKGVIVASAGTTTANTINAIIATNGPAYVKSSAGTVQAFVTEGATTAGYAITTTTQTSTIKDQNQYSVLGVAESTRSTTCAANADTCRTSLLVNLSIQ